jgi:Carboxypeptidase regulatory-like domain
MRGESQLNPRTAKSLLAAAFLALALSLSFPLRAQVTGATLSGAITDQSGAVVPNAKISVKNVATAESVETKTDPAGHYIIPNLQPGDYELSVSAESFSTNTAKVTIAAGANQITNLTLAGVLSLGDLGFSPAQSQGSAQDQARLDKRSHMLKVHQRVGLIDTIPLVATVILGPGAGGKKTSSTDRWAHLALGSVTGDLYFISAWYAIRAPRIEGTETRGGIRLHKILAWIHGPGMIATPILGAMAFDQKSNGRKVHGIASAHGPVAIITASAYGASILAVSFKW